MISKFPKRVAIGAGIVALVGLVLARYLFEGWYVRGSAMEPTLPDGAFVLSRRTFGAAERGDIVTIRTAPDGTPDLMCRVIGLAGDVVAVRGSDARVNGQAVQYSTGAKHAAGSGGTAEENAGLEDASSKTLTIPAQHVFVMSDNPATTTDSRTFGPVPNEEVEYKVIMQLPSGR